MARRTKEEAEQTRKDILQAALDMFCEKGYTRTTLDDIAKSIGLSKSTIQRYEKGTISRIKLPVIESIARVLNVDPNWLIGNTDIPGTSSTSCSSSSEWILTYNEQALIRDYRDASPEIREAAASMLKRSADRSREDRQRSS